MVSDYRRKLPVPKKSSPDMFLYVCVCQVHLNYLIFVLFPPVGLLSQWPRGHKPFRDLCHIKQLCLNHGGHHWIRTIQRWAVLSPVLRLLLCGPFPHYSEVLWSSISVSVLSGFVSLLHYWILFATFWVYKPPICPCSHCPTFVFVFFKSLKYKR